MRMRRIEIKQLFHKNIPQSSIYHYIQFQFMIPYSFPEIYRTVYKHRTPSKQVGSHKKTGMALELTINYLQ